MGLKEIFKMLNINFHCDMLLHVRVLKNLLLLIAFEKLAKGRVIVLFISHNLLRRASHNLEERVDITGIFIVSLAATVYSISCYSRFPLAELGWPR